MKEPPEVLSHPSLLSLGHPLRRLPASTIDPTKENQMSNKRAAAETLLTLIAVLVAFNLAATLWLAAT